MTKIFFIEETSRERLYLRRYSAVGDTCTKSSHKCTKTGHYCNAMAFIGIEPLERDSAGYARNRDERKPPQSDPRWPTVCEACGEAFGATDEFQLFGQTIYRRVDNAEEMTLREAPAGAVWNAWWIADRREETQRGCAWMVGPDGRSLVVRMPDGSDWMIDSRARNCTMKDDNEHFCWVRHGRPEDGTLHVDKNGRTCAAGAGSIDTGKWHGFLHNGQLTP